MALSPEDVVRAGYLLDQGAEDGEGERGDNMDQITK
jgi:hypothetical protein